MKVAAVITILALVLLPLIIWVIFLFIKLFTKGTEGTSQFFTKTLLPSQSKPRRKLMVAIFIIYGILIISAATWALSVLLADQIETSKLLIYSIVGILVIFLGEVTLIFLAFRYENKINPLPKPGSDTKTILEWENRRSDLLSKNLGRYFLFLLAYSVAAFFTFGLIIYFFG